MVTFLYYMRMIIQLSLLLAILAFPASAGEIKVDAKAPDFELSNQEGKMVKLSDYSGKNIVLIFSRAHWWPFCIKQLVQLQKSSADFKKLNTEVVVVFREERDGLKGLKTTQTKTKLTTLLLDTPTKITSDWSKDTFATYLIDSNRIIKAVMNGTKKKRPSSTEIIQKAEEVFSQ